MYKKEIFTIPNILSLFRIILAFVFLYIAAQFGISENRMLLVSILVISGFSDFLDGKIARRFNMVSELGKIIDPIADKLTQAVLLICCLGKYTLSRYVFVLFIIKEIYMFINGTRTIMVTGSNDGAMWYGKVSTATFYAVMFILFLFPDIPDVAAEVMIMLCGLLMLMAFILYARHYKQLQKETKQYNDDKKIRERKVI